MDVVKIANLAKIEIVEDEKERIKKDFERIVSWIDELKEVDVSDITPISQTVNSSFREDIEKPFENREGIIRNFPKREFDFVKVKKVIE